jgi:flagellar hook-length control protein FliK
MIAQQLLTTTTSAAKSQAQQAQQQGLQQAQNVASGFQSMLSMTDSSLTDLAQKTGAGATTTPQPANANKKNNTSDTTTTPYVQAPNQPAQPSQTQPAAGNPAASGATGVANNALTPATDPTATAAAAAPTDQNGAANTGNANSSAFGADALNARIVAGAPIYASQPTAAMATVPAHLLDAANAHPLPGEPVGQPGDAPTAATTTSGKASTDANAVMTPSTGSATAPTTTLLPAHQAVTAVGGNNDKSDDGSSSPSQAADAATQTTNDPSTPSASLLTQPNAPQTTPAQIDAATHTAAPYVPVGEQVAINLKQALNADNNEIRIQLKPASLGTIDVKLNVGQDGRINAVISADRSDTLNMLKQDSGTLQQALKDAGLNADSSSLSFNLNSNAQSFAQNSSQGGSSSNGGGNGGAYASGNAGDASAGNDTTAPVQRSHSGALNIEV